jgi:o-succinylbenzoate---CoA ligase
MERRELANLLGGYQRHRAAAHVVIGQDQDFAERFATAVASEGPVFLTAAEWGEREQAQHAALAAQHAPDSLRRGWLAIPTGGSSGAMKLARHDGETLGAAVAGFVNHFGVRRAHVVGLLPRHHVGGLLGWLRAMLTGGSYCPADWKEVVRGEWPDLPMRTEADAGWFVSLVPTQLARLLAQPAAVERLRRFRAVLVSGGPSSPDLLARAAAAGVPLALGYGATETAAMVTVLRPEEFAAGRRDCGTGLPHARLRLDEAGVVHVRATSLFRGYWPAMMVADEWCAGDRGAFTDEGGLLVRGRSDALIITGGEKVAPAEIEEALRAAGWLEVVVVGVSDAQWGQRVVACVPPGGPAALPALATLAAWKRPKELRVIAPWPVNALGKINRAEVARLAETASAMNR